MKPTVDAVALQIDIIKGDPAANISALSERLAELHRTQSLPDLIVLPELALTGYVQQRDRFFGKSFMKLAETVPGPLTDSLSELASKHQIHLISGFLEAHRDIPGIMYNSSVLIGPDGSHIGTQRKMHIPGEEKHYLTPGNEIKTFDTDLGKLSIQICYDAFFPEMARIQALQGSEIQCVLYNAHRVAVPPGLIASTAAARAAENKLFVLVANRIGKEGDAIFTGGSAIADPFGSILAEGDDTEQAVLATLCADNILEERAFQPSLMDRRPEIYKPLTDQTIL